MEPFTTHTGQAAPLKRSNVDTDQIIPVRFLTRSQKQGYGEHLFHDWREDPAFVLNQPHFCEATILVAGPDFGTGSSRESAVWAIQGYGIRAVVAPRFGDIFKGNALKNGLLPAVVSMDAVTQIWTLLDEDPTCPVTVDLVDRMVRAGTVEEPVEIDDFTRWRLMEGLDDVSITLRFADDIDRFEHTRRSALPTTRRTEG